MLPIASFVLAWLETWFLDFKVLTQEADDERGESAAPGSPEGGRGALFTRVPPGLQPI